ncbi:E3 ubiquitin-protein ligase NHLRC1 [Dromiciops gliroides]|uniref:E3 ubiquitin-protein ligase NHLRC1 n=1 Tax=Dromiciops gliroides TaxID=33562 RepID=UPI001CC80098|nr:E3 ubiquitin-protein ligase NHLRC1 [Dromiciops gliroides]
MSTQPSSHSIVRALFREIEMNLMECKICLEKFIPERQDRLDRRRNLFCRHVCTGCLVALAQPQARSSECTFCRQESTDPNACLPLLQFREGLGPILRIISTARALTPQPPRLRWFRALTCIQSFGGWGSLVNPTSFALCPRSGKVVVVHEGKKRVKIFGLDGMCITEFGEKGEKPHSIQYPLGVTTTPDGYVILTDAGDHSVKVFDFSGQSKLIIGGLFSLPWGVQTTPQKKILVADAGAGLLHLLEIDFQAGALKKAEKLLTHLCNPRALSVSQINGIIAVVEHLIPQGTCPVSTRIRVYSPSLQLLGQVDSFELSLLHRSQMETSAVTVDHLGNIIVADTTNHAVVCLGKPQEFPNMMPVITQGLSYPVALICGQDNSFFVLDSGIHAVKMYKPDRYF